MSAYSDAQIAQLIADHAALQDEVAALKEWAGQVKTEIAEIAGCLDDGLQDEAEKRVRVLLRAFLAAHA